MLLFIVSDNRNSNKRFITLQFFKIPPYLIKDFLRKIIIGLLIDLEILSIPFHRLLYYILESKGDIIDNSSSTKQERACINCANINLTLLTDFILTPTY